VQTMCDISHNPRPETCPFGFAPHTNKTFEILGKAKKWQKINPQP
jgi:hypothetical protein